MPAVFGKYQMLTRIASGGMAEVWLARSSSLGGFEKLLAIKRMHSALSRNQSFVSMFIDEAKLTVSLSHPNIVQVFDFGRVDDDYFMAMEYVEGVDLATLAKHARRRMAPLPVDVSLYLMRGVFDGLAYAHLKVDRYGRPAGIIHRDVSPQNVLVSFDGHVKVSDFGIARAASKVEQTRRGEILGKVAYLSPEQSRGEVVTEATDIWAAGVILHELLTNTRLFVRSDDAATLEAVKTGHIPRPSELNEEVPSALDEVLGRILTREPEGRLSSAREVAAQLGELLRVRYPAASEYRMRDVLAELWDHQLPRLLPAADERERTRDARPSHTEGHSSHSLASLASEQTKPVGERTAEQIAASARHLRALGDTRSWSSASAFGQRLEVTDVDLDGPTDETERMDEVVVAGGLIDATMHGVELTSRDGEATRVEGSAVPEGMEREEGSSTALAEVLSLKARFVREPNLWTLVDVGRAYDRAGLSALASGAYKLAAAKFAQRGLLVQAAAIYADLFADAHLSEPLAAEIRRLPALQGLTNEDLERAVFSGAGPETDYSDYRGIFAPGRDPVDVYTESPILSSLSSEQLVGIVSALDPRHFAVGETIVREGDAGESFFLLARGRVVVSTTNFAGEKIYVTSLLDGDCFGEHGFFTGEPRTATVEALEDVLVLEVAKDVLERLIEEFPTVRESLRRFYKERIAESLLAKSPMFGQLSITARKMFAERFTFETFAVGDLIIREGDRSDAFYAIKTGRVLVYTGGEDRSDVDPSSGGATVRLAELGPGEIFGEIAAVEGTLRTASVRALEPCEILRLEASELNALLARHVDIRRMLGEKIEERSESRLRRI